MFIACHRFSMQQSLRLEQLVAGHVGDEQVVFVDHFDEAGLATFGRGIALALAVAGG